MKKILFNIASVLFLLTVFSGCTGIYEKNASVSVIYGTVALFSLILLVGYCYLVYKKDILFFFLFTSVFVVNLGYYLLSVSQTLESALFANRISYLGSVFLPLLMLLIIMKVCKIDYQKWFIAVLSAISIIVFLIAASPGYLDIYYKSVSLATINGVSVLEKVYGPLHVIYLFYLIFYFISMVGIIVYSRIERKIEESVPAVILAVSVFINISVWLFEQFIKVDFELLSVSYIITEVFLLGIHLLLKEKEDEKKNNAPASADNEYTYKKSFSDNFKNISVPKYYECESYSECLLSLTQTERKIFDLHLSGKKTKEIMEELCITENTVKFHNKNIYRKFGVSSKKELLAFSKNHIKK